MCVHVPQASSASAPPCLSRALTHPTLAVQVHSRANMHACAHVRARTYTHVDTPLCMPVPPPQGRAAGTLPPLDPSLAAAEVVAAGEGTAAGPRPPGSHLMPGMLSGYMSVALGGVLPPGPGHGRAGPGPRFGKRAYIRAVPHVVAGLRRHK